MLKKIFFAACLSVASIASQAGVISHFGYERDSNSNIVKGGGLEWLMWDVTKGLSINEALDAHAGWKLASNVQMASLFNNFKFGKTDWVANELLFQEATAPWSADEESLHMSFIQLFGYTTLTTGTRYATSDAYLAAAALFGSDANGDGGYNMARIADDSTHLSFGKSEHMAYLFEDSSSRDAFSAYPDLGVALVREIKLVPPSQVSLPGSISLLALGLFSLALRRRQASCR